MMRRIGGVLVTVGGFRTDVAMSQDRPHQTPCSDLRSELAVAEELQRKLYPDHAPLVAGFDIGGVSRPVEATNGDCFDYIPLPDGALGVVVADVRGHGLPAALVMVQAQAYLRAYATCETDIAKIITRTNVALAADASVGYFVTCLLLRLEPGGRSLTYVNAGHPPGIVVGCDGKRRELVGNSPLLGVLPDAQFEAVGMVPLEAEEIMVLFTDGVTESRSPTREFFERERVADAVLRNAGAPADVICERVLAAADAFRDGAPQQDDMTCVIVKVG